MCHVVQCPGTNAPVIVDDCGSSNQAGAMDPDDVVAKVQSLVGASDVIVLATHKDVDHNSYLPKIFPISTAHKPNIKIVWAGGNYGTYSAAMQSWFTAAKNAGLKLRVSKYTAGGVVEGFTSGWSNSGNAVPALQCGAAKTYVLTVNTEDGANVGSMVVMLDYGGQKLVFPGDATGKTQEKAVDNFKSPKAPANFLQTDVLETSHHGSSNAKSNDLEWARATLPRYLISSAGESHFHPRCDAIDNYRFSEDKATGKYKPRLIGVSDGHRFFCGDTQWWFYDPEMRAIYSTNSNGTIIVDVAPPSTKGERVKVYWEYN